MSTHSTIARRRADGVATTRPLLRGSLACLNAAPWNPYLKLLHDHLQQRGFNVLADVELTLPWLWRSRRDVGFLHVHWPEPLYRYGRGPTALQPLLSWVKLCVFVGRLLVARALGYRVVWTVHQIRPHDSSDARLERYAPTLLVRLADLLLVHEQSTADRIRTEFGTAIAKKATIVPHGSYIGVYPAGRPRPLVRSALRIPPDAVAFLCFGELRAYKAVDILLSAFRAAALPNATLVIAGHAKDNAVAAAVADAAAADARVRPLVGDFFPDGRVAELFGACDVAVVPRGDGGTSGSLLLACSLGLPVVAADAGASAELLRETGAGWTFVPDDPESLRDVLELAAADPAEMRRRGEASHAEARRRAWPELADRTARLLEGTRGRTR